MIYRLWWKFAITIAKIAISAQPDDDFIRNHAAQNEDPILTPTPSTEFLTMDFCVQPGLGQKFLLRRTWSGQQKNCSHCNFQDFHSLSKGNQVSLVRIHFAHPESEVVGTQAGTKTKDQNAKFSKLKQLAILKPIRFDTPLRAAKETPKRVPK